jgi:hypothetical protein
LGNEQGCGELDSFCRYQLTVVGVTYTRNLELTSHRHGLFKGIIILQNALLTDTDTYADASDRQLWVPQLKAVTIQGRHEQDSYLRTNERDWTEQDEKQD